MFQALVLGCRAWGLWFRIWGLWVQALEFEVYRVSREGFWVLGLGFTAFRV